jgi:hypothetical protein
MYQKSADFLKDFYHEAHEELTGDKKTFVLFVVSISLHLELLRKLFMDNSLVAARKAQAGKF